MLKLACKLSATPLADAPLLVALPAPNAIDFLHVVLQWIQSLPGGSSKHSLVSGIPLSGELESSRWQGCHAQGCCLCYGHMRLAPLQH